MNPYRLTPLSASMTCLDPPRVNTCGEASKPKRRVEYLLAAGVGVALATGSFALHAVGHGGHVEIAPAALAHARAHRHPPKARTPHVVAAVKAPPKVVASALPAERAWLGGTHDDKQLTARAKHLESMGLDVTVDDVPLSSALTRWTDFRDDYFPMASLPIHDTASQISGLEIRGLPDSSPLRVAGLANGDALLGLDGYRFDDDTFRNIDVVAIRKRGSMVVELARGRHHVVLAIHWKTTRTE